MADMPSHIYADWMRYYKVEPFGEERADLRMGIMTANLMAALSSLSAQFAGKGRGKSFKPRDFMPFSKAARQRFEPLPDKVLFKKVLILNRLYGGKVIDLRQKA